jgi:hypothetical protein
MCAILPDEDDTDALAEDQLYRIVVSQQGFYSIIALIMLFTVLK